MDLGELARILRHPEDPPPAPATTPRRAAPRWLVDLLSELPPEPRYPNSSRVIPQHLRNASTAAWHLVEPGVLEDDPGALKRYLNLTAAQLRHHLEKDVVGGPFYEHELSGRYLQEAFFGPGARDDWKTTVLRATGEELNPRYFVGTL